MYSLKTNRDIELIEGGVTVKINRLLMAAICLFAGAVANFCLAFIGNNFVIRILDGIFFSVGAFLALREWNKQKKNND